MEYNGQKSVISDYAFIDHFQREVTFQDFHNDIIANFSNPEEMSMSTQTVYK